MHEVGFLPTESWLGTTEDLGPMQAQPLGLGHCLGRWSLICMCPTCSEVPAQKAATLGFLP
jgi:hypothetical protein